jgi:hypothetical protein
MARAFTGLSRAKNDRYLERDLQEATNLASNLSGEVLRLREGALKKLER